MMTLEYDTLIPLRRLKRHIFVSFLILIPAIGAAHGKALQLTLYPAKVAEPAQTYRLLPSPVKQTDEDAVPLYEKSIQSMPKETNRRHILGWLTLPREQFPQKKAEQVIQEHLESLRLVTRAVRCQKCNWPERESGDAPLELDRFKDLAVVIRLWTRLEIYRGQYKGALIALQTALGLTRHLSQIPSMAELLVVTAFCRDACQELEQFVQGKDSPNLYVALASLPQPLVGVEKAIEKNWVHLRASLMQELSEKQLKAAKKLYDRIRWIAKRLDNHVNALQVVEAIRHYAATHDGQLPQVLDDIQDIKVPNDLVSGQAFEYRRTATSVTLKAAIPEGGNERDTVHYEIVLSK